MKMVVKRPFFSVRFLEGRILILRSATQAHRTYKDLIILGQNLEILVIVRMSGLTFSLMI